MQDIQKQAAIGVKWQGIVEIATRILQLTTTIVLARLLLTAEFGLINIAMIFVQLAFVLFDFGLSSALIQKKEIDSRVWPAAATFYLILGLLFFLLMQVLARPLAGWLNQPDFVTALRLLSFIFIIYAFSALPQVQLIRAMRFTELAGLQIIATIFYAVLTILLAFFGWGIYSFLTGLLAEQVVLTLLVTRRSAVPFSFTRQLGALKTFFGYGGSIQGSRLTGYFNLNLPNILIGKYLGATALGYYALAYQVIEFPVQRISKNILKVMFPALSKLQENKDEYLHLYRNTLYYILLLVTPLFAGLMITAPDLVLLIYGSKWLPAVLILQMLTGIGLLRSLWTMCSVVFLSKARPHWEFILNIIYGLALGLVLYLFVRQGVEKLVPYMIMVFAVIWIAGQVLALRLSGLSFLDWIKTIRIPMGATAAFMAVHYLLLFRQGYPDTPLFRLLQMILQSMLIYAGVVYLADRSIFSRLIRFLKVS